MGHSGVKSTRLLHIEEEILRKEEDEGLPLFWVNSGVILQTRTITYVEKCTSLLLHSSVYIP